MIIGRIDSNEPVIMIGYKSTVVGSVPVPIVLIFYLWIDLNKFGGTVRGFSECRSCSIIPIRT